MEIYISLSRFQRLASLYPLSGQSSAIMLTKFKLYLNLVCGKAFVLASVGLSLMEIFSTLTSPYDKISLTKYSFNIKMLMPFMINLVFGKVNKTLIIACTNKHSCYIPRSHISHLSHSAS